MVGKRQSLSLGNLDNLNGESKKKKIEQILVTSKNENKQFF